MRARSPGKLRLITSVPALAGKRMKHKPDRLFRRASGRSGDAGDAQT